jgi:hypothetical protein
MPKYNILLKQLKDNSNTNMLGLQQSNKIFLIIKKINENS